MSGNKTCLIYLDPTFEKLQGHYETFAKNMAFEAHNRGIKFLHATNQYIDPELREQMAVSNVFYFRGFLIKQGYSNLTKAIVRLLLSILNKRREILLRELRDLLLVILPKQKRIFIWFFKKNLENYLSKLNLSDYDKIILYLYTGNLYHVEAIAEVLCKKEFSSLPLKAFSTIFYLDNKFCLGVQSKAYKEELKSTNQLLEVKQLFEKIQICFDSSRALDLYQSYFNQPLRLLPHLHSHNLAPHRVEGIATQGDRIVIGYFGAATKKQGYDLVYQLYLQLIEEDKLKNVSFIIRHDLLNRDRELKNSSENFFDKKLNIDHIMGRMSEVEYFSYLRKCDVILTPYLREEYPVQTSGVMINALMCSKLVVVPENTWLSDVVDEFNVGVSFASGDFQSFYSAVRAVTKNIEFYKNRAQGNFDKFVSYHTAENFFDQICNILPQKNIFRGA